MSRDRKVVRVGCCFECPFATPPKPTVDVDEVCWHPLRGCEDVQQTNLMYAPNGCPLRHTSVLVEHDAGCGR